jgi:RHS repeat-associated protein
VQLAFACLLLASSPVFVATASPESQAPNRALPQFTPVSVLPTLSEKPTDEEIARLRLFPQALVPVDAPASTGLFERLRGNSARPAPGADNSAVAPTLRALAADSRPADTSLLDAFLGQHQGQHPVSRWSAALRFERARRWFISGFFFRAMDEWATLWQELKDRRDPGSVAIADETVARLLEAYIGCGQSEKLVQLIGDQESRPGNGVIEAKVLRAKQSVWLLKHRGSQNVMCGPLALYCLLDHERRAFQPIRLNDITDDHIATGLSLAELGQWADGYGLGLIMARWAAPGEVPTPAVMHTRANHYCALLAREGEQYLLEDRSMQFVGWVSAEAVQSLATGYFLVRSNAFPARWARVDKAEASSIYGRDGAHGQQPLSRSISNDSCNSGGGGGGACGMPAYTFFPQVAALRVRDRPVGYRPPFGPSVYFTISFNDLDDSKPVSNPTYSNVGRMWSVNWVAYVDHVTGTLTNSSKVTVHLPGGGTEVSTYSSATGQFGPNDRSFATVVRSGTATYTRTLPDGSKEVYDAPDNPTTPVRVFLTQLLDPQGNGLTFTYDTNLRLVAVADAIGQVTTLQYTNAADIYKVTGIVDPFGRTAALGYDPNGRPISVTDAMGMTSTFTHDPTDFVTSMTTLYGTTTFSNLLGPMSWDRTITVTDPEGDRERVQYVEPIKVPDSGTPVPSVINVRGSNITFLAENARMIFRNSFYWSKKAMRDAPDDIKSAVNYRWYTDSSYLITPILEAVKQPLEERVWFNYPNQVGGTYPYYAGQGGKPVKMLRVLSDGTPQMLQTYYNALGSLTNYIDPLGRSTVFFYDSNQIDLVEIRQFVGDTNYQRLLAITNNAQHRPLTIVDAAGQSRTATYNARGQITSATDQRGFTTTFSYDTNGYLTLIDGPLAGTNDYLAFTHDTVGRIRTVTSSDAYTLTVDYDNLDRITRITYPDATYEQFDYARLDQTGYRDRLGRQTTYAYDGIGRLVQITDPLQRVIRLAWCRCGALNSVTDPMGKTTFWEYDIQGRRVAKRYADGSQINYRYDPAVDRLLQVIDEKAQVTSFAYQLDGNVTQISYSNSIVPTPPVTFQYDTNYARLVAMVDGSGTTAYSYYPITGLSSPGAGMLAAIDGPLPNDSVTYAYDEAGQLTNRAINGVGFGVVRDPANRVTAFTNILGTFLRSYDGPTRRISSLTCPNGLVSTSTYFGNLQDRRLQQITNRLGATTYSVSAYAYTAIDQITNWTQQADLNPADAHSFLYDALGRVTESHVTRGGVPVHDFAYSYDPSDNRTLEQVDGVPRVFSYNVLNELTTSSLQVTNPATYEWDGEHRLSAINRGTNRTEFSYDGADRCVRIVEKGGPATISDLRYVWCGSELCEERDATGATVLRRFFGQGVQVSSGPAAGSYYYTVDHLGSVREMIDSAGTLRARYDYDPYGRRTKLAGDLEAAFGFTGHFVHAPSGLHLAWFRAYDADTARWLRRDPLGEIAGLNLFAYVGDDPVNLSDRLGLESYDSPDEAGEAAVRNINKRSIRTGHEFAGKICQSKLTSRFFYTSPRMGGKDKSWPGDCPWYSDDAGQYHTHGWDDPYHDNENFSPMDKETAGSKPSYLATPKGEIYKWQPLPCSPDGGMQQHMGSGAK